MKRALPLAAALLLAACGSDATAPAPAGRAGAGHARTPAAPAKPAVPPIAIYPPPISIPPAPDRPPDQCGAWELQGLVGKHRTAIPVPVQPSRRRVICTTCPRTMDYNPQRQTIEYDPATSLVTSVTCG